MIHLVFSFAEKFDIIIEFLEVENARSFLHFMVYSFKLCDMTQIVSVISDLGLSFDLQKLLIFAWTSFSFCLADPGLGIYLILLTKFKASLPTPCSFKCSPCIPRKLCPILLLSIVSSEDSDNKLFKLLIEKVCKVNQI